MGHCSEMPTLRGRTFPGRGHGWQISQGYGWRAPTFTGRVWSGLRSSGPACRELTSGALICDLRVGATLNWPRPLIRQTFVVG